MGKHYPRANSLVWYLSSWGDDLAYLRGTRRIALRVGIGPAVAWLWCILAETLRWLHWQLRSTRLAPALDQARWWAHRYAYSRHYERRSW